MSALVQLLNSSILLNLLIQSTVFAACALVVLRGLKRRAVWRYAIAYWSLIGLGLLGVISLFVQSRSHPVTFTPLDLAIFTEQLEFLNPLLSGEMAPGFEEIQPQLGPLDVPLAFGIEGSDAATQKFPFFSNWNSSWIIAGLAVLWLLGILVSGVRLLSAALRLHAMEQRAIPLTPKQQMRITNVLNALAYDATSVSIRISDAVTSPVQIGLLRTKILLPHRFIEHCNSQQLESVMLHELAHWQRRDNIANLLQKTILCLFWFHPLVQRLDQIAAQSCEEICDNFVLARYNPVDYGETLLWISTLQDNATEFGSSNQLAVEIIGRQWNLEERIRELIDQKRETAMQLSNKSVIVIRLTSIGISALVASCILVPNVGSVSALEPQSTQATTTGQTDQPGTQTQAQTQRQPPPARDAETLSEEVFNAITQIQQHLQPEAEESEQDLELAKELLDKLYEEQFATANSFEQATILNYYTNYYLTLEDYPETLRVFEQLLTVENLREDIRLRTLRSLGQLYSAEEHWQQSIDAYAQWLQQADRDDAVVFRGLSYAHYQLEQWQDALDYWMRYWNTQTSAELDRDDYAFRNGLYFTLEDYESALELTKEMILRFNHETDWRNLQTLYSLLNEESTIADLSAELGGTLNVNVAEPEIAFATVVPTDGDYLPLVAIAPMYPRAAADGGIEGWVLLSFTVNERGSVVEDTIVVEDAEPANLFDNNSIRAASQFKFQPRMVAGEAQAVPGVQYLFRFRLRDDDA